MTDVGEVKVAITADTSGFRTGIAQAKDSLKDWRDSTNANTGEMLQWGTAIGAAAAGPIALGYAALKVAQEINAMVAAVATANQEIARMSVITGMSVEELYKWKNVARYADSDISTLSAALAKLSININSSGGEASAAAQYLEAMGISAKDANGSTRNMSELFPEIIEGLKTVSDVSDKNTISMALFGRSYKDLSGYMLLSKSELQGYFEAGWAPSKEQQNQLREYDIASKNMDKTMAGLSKSVALEFLPVMTDLAASMTDLTKDGSGFLEMVGMLADGMSELVAVADDAATGFQIWQSLAAGGKNTQQIVRDHHIRDSERQRRKDAARTPKDQSPGLGESRNILDLPGQAKGKFVMPIVSGGENRTEMTTYEIARQQVELDTLTRRTIPDQKTALKKLEDEYVKLGDKGTDAAKKIRGELLGMRNDIALSEIKIDEMRAKLTSAGAAVSGTQTGGETYNEMFKSSLQAGGVGPDWAGYSSLANLDPKTLEKFAGGDFELTGGSKGMQENARQLRDRMLAEQKIGGGEDKKTKGEEKKAKPLAEQTKNDTAIIKTETEKQATQFTKLNKTIGDGWIGLEKRGLVHYTAMSELARIAAQAEIDYMRDCVNFGGEHPIIQNKIIMSATGPDWAPPPFQALASTKLAAANFSSVAFSGDIGKKSEGDEKGEEKTKNEVVVNVAVNVDKNGLATASAKSTTTAIQRSGVGT